MVDQMRRHVSALQDLAIEAAVAFNHMHAHCVGMEDFKELHPDLYDSIIAWNSFSNSNHATLVFSLCRTIRTMLHQRDNEILMRSCKECSSDPEKPCEFHRGFFMGLTVMGNEIGKDDDAVNEALFEICERYGIVRNGMSDETDQP